MHLLGGDGGLELLELALVVLDLLALLDVLVLESLHLLLGRLEVLDQLVLLLLHLLELLLLTVLLLLDPLELSPLVLQPHLQRARLGRHLRHVGIALARALLVQRRLLAALLRLGRHERLGGRLRLLELLHVRLGRAQQVELHEL